MTTNHPPRGQHAEPVTVEVTLDSGPVTVELDVRPRFEEPTMAKANRPTGCSCACPPEGMGSGSGTSG